MEDEVRTKETIQKIVHGSESAERNDRSPGEFFDLFSETKHVSDHHPHRAALSVCRPAQKRRSSHGQLAGRSKMQKMKRVGAVVRIKVSAKATETEITLNGLNVINVSAACRNINTNSTHFSGKIFRHEPKRKSE